LRGASSGSRSATGATTSTPRAPLASRRLAALAELNARGIETYAFVGPLLPHFRYDRDALDTLFAGLARAGVRQVYVEHINLRPYILQRLGRALRSAPPEVRAVYGGAKTDERRAQRAVAPQPANTDHQRAHDQRPDPDLEREPQDEERPGNLPSVTTRSA
jgi:DNA repair photolyase